MRNFDENITQINQMIIEMIKNVERMINITIDELRNKAFSKELYGECKLIEEEVNDYQIAVDEKCIETIARFQPAASDLRYLVGIMHMNVDLERIGDLCSSVLKTLKRISKEKGELSKEIVPLSEMGKKVLKMYEMFVKGYIEKEYKVGYEILQMDTEIDYLKRIHSDEIEDKIKENMEYLELGIKNILIARIYERVGDNIKNLAESLVYIYQGRDLRHIKGSIKDESINS